MSEDKPAQDDKLSETEAAVTECGPNTTFSYRDRKNGNEPSYTCKVPANVHWIHMVVAGGPGGYASDQPGYESGGPGKNSVIAGYVPVVPNEILSIYVGDGGRHSPDARSGYAPGGRGGPAPQATASQGGGGGGSSAVVGSVSGPLIHAGGGGGAGGAGVAGDGGSGGHGGLNPAGGTDGHGKGGQGGGGGDKTLPDRGGNGHGGGDLQAGGGGGGGGGGQFGGQGGGFNALGGGGGGGGGGSSFIVPSSTDVVEGNPFTGKPGQVVFNSFR